MSFCGSPVNSRSRIDAGLRPVRSQFARRDLRNTQNACSSIALRKIATTLQGMNPQVTVWYDGACPLCLREIAVMRRLDRRGAIEFVDVSVAEATSCPIDPSELLARFHASEDGQLFSGAAAFAAMWRAIPLLRPLGLLARNRFVLRLLERFYTVFLKHRPKLQRWARRHQAKGRR